jgi:hypothetical protein
MKTPANLGKVGTEHLLKLDRDFSNRKERNCSKKCKNQSVKNVTTEKKDPDSPWIPVKAVPGSS